ncbi:START domain-containing protein 10 isoform X4 [Tursiops truncatus]
MAHGPSHSAACRIFPDRGTNPCPLHRQADSQPLHHQGSPVQPVFAVTNWLCSEGRIIPVSQMKILGFRTEVLCSSQGHTGRKQQDRGLSDQTAWNCCKCELVGQRDGPSLLRGDFQCRMECRDVPAETLYDVLHDIEYRKKWDSNVIETFDIARLTVNADVGYYSWRCPKPLKNRDVITLRSWLPMGTDYIIMNYSVKHPKYPPRKDLVRAVSIQTGYLIQSTGPKSCVITYMAQVDPKGSLPKWVVNKSSQFLAPKAMKKMYKACVKYPEWKQKHQPHFKPWLHPEQSPLPSLALSELSVQHADSLENIDESAVAESREERVGSAGGEGSDDDTSLT